MSPLAQRKSSASGKNSDGSTQSFSQGTQLLSLLLNSYTLHDVASFEEISQTVSIVLNAVLKFMVYTCYIHTSMIKIS